MSHTILVITSSRMNFACKVIFISLLLHHLSITYKVFISDSFDILKSSWSKGCIAFSMLGGPEIQNMDLIIALVSANRLQEPL